MVVENAGAIQQVAIELEATKRMSDDRVRAIMAEYQPAPHPQPYAVDSRAMFAEIATESTSSVASV